MNERIQQKKSAAEQKEIDDLRSILYHKEVELQQKEAKLNLIETFLKSAVS